jgi:hypothetical protein
MMKALGHREWIAGRQHGQGTYMFSNGDEYHGQFDRGLQHGVFLAAAWLVRACAGV